MSTFHPARIFFLLAREANKAIIFRRGPTKWTQMIVWDLDENTLEFGQWTKIKLSPRRCDLSPNGEYLIYYDDQFEGISTTAISKPPYWETLCKWKHKYSGPNLGYGGGLFKSDTELYLNFSTEGLFTSRVGLHYNINNDKYFEGNLASFLKIEGFSNKRSEYNFWKGHINPLLEIRMKRDGWKEIEDKEFIEKETSNMVLRKPSKTWNNISPNSKDPMEPKLFEKEITTSSFLWMITYYHSDLGKMLTTFYIKRRNIKTKLEGIAWADIDYNGRIIGTKEGKLYGSKRLKDGSVQLSNLEMLHDLNSQKPTKISVPKGMKNW
ncbi:MAG: hypothetical protein JKX68_03870 [Flavobacteriales bacterium]|nr:hypothetical protein [Flavobacteriales bacterium]